MIRSELGTKIIGVGEDGGVSRVEGPREEKGASFSQELGKAISEVDNLQVAADKEADLVAQGQGNLHEMAIALEKADVSMRLALKVRNKVVEAYNEIMRMTV